MKRIEIIYSQSLEEDILESISDMKEANAYTIIPMVYGKGNSVPKMGDAIWPEVNRIMLMYCEDEQAALEIEKRIATVRESYPTEGIAFFMM